MGQAAILAEVHFNFDIIQTAAAGGEFLVGIVDPFLPEGVVHEVEINTCIVRTDGLHQGMNLLGVASIGGKDDGDVAHRLNSLFYNVLELVSYVLDFASWVKRHGLRFPTRPFLLNPVAAVCRL